MGGQPIILLGGFMCDERLFAAQCADLGAAGFRVQTGDITRAADIRRIARQVLADAPPRFALAGLSMGGIVAFEVLRQAPARITHLGLLNTTPRPDAARPARLSQLKRVAHGELDRVIREDLKPNYLAPVNRTPDRLVLLEAMGHDLGQDVFARQTLALMNRIGSEDLLPDITCPALVLCGADDTICPPALHREMASLIPDAELTILPDCGHISPLEQPGAVTAALARLLARPPALYAVRRGPASESE